MRLPNSFAISGRVISLVVSCGAGGEVGGFLVAVAAVVPGNNDVEDLISARAHLE